MIRRVSNSHGLLRKLRGIRVAAETTPSFKTSSDWCMRCRHEFQKYSHRNTGIHLIQEEIL
jgi:hypothetical protein